MTEEGLNRLHVMSSSPCWCGERHARIAGMTQEQARTVSYTEVIRFDGHAAGRRWHYGHEPGWACNTRCTTVRPGVVMEPVKPASTTAEEPGRLVRDRKCTMCRMYESHRAFQAEISEEGRTAGMCSWCAELWETVQWPRSVAWLDERQRRGQLGRATAGLMAALAVIALVVVIPAWPWPVWSLTTVLTLFAWYQVLRIRDSARAAEARRRERGKR